VSSLGRVPGAPGAYEDMTRHPENAPIPVPGVLILRLDAPMYFANALTVRDKVKAMVDDAGMPLRAVILTGAVQDQLDFTSADVLKGLVKQLHDNGLAVYVADVHAPVLDFSRRTGLLDLIGEKNVFATVDLAVQAIET
jgi:sulfate permease, SulP family